MANQTTLLLLDWSIVDQLNLRNSCRDKTSPESRGPETPRCGGAVKSGIGCWVPLVSVWNQIGDKGIIGRLKPVVPRKPRWDYARRKHISSAFGRGFKSLQLHSPPLIALTSVPRPELFLCRLAPVMRREGAKGLWLITRATAAHKDSMILAIMVEIYTCKYTYSILTSNNFNSVACRF